MAHFWHRMLAINVIFCEALILIKEGLRNGQFIRVFL
jgi:hypothetical protein